MKAWLGLAVALWACGEASEPEDAAPDASPPPGRFDLVDPDLWRPIPLPSDPVPPAREVRCDPRGFGAEQLGPAYVFSVDTGDCDHLTVRQVTRAAIYAGDTVRLALWHFELTAPAPATGVAQVNLDGALVFDEQVPIPRPAALRESSYVATASVPAGAPVWFHVHNHGANSWSLVELTTER